MTLNMSVVPYYTRRCTRKVPKSVSREPQRISQKSLMDSIFSIFACEKKCLEMENPKDQDETRGSTAEIESQSLNYRVFDLT